MANTSLVIPSTARRGSPAVRIHPRAAHAHGLDPDLSLPVGAVVVLADGFTLRVREDGGLDVWPPRQFSSIAADPTAST